MIYGIGHDIVYIDRIKKLLETYHHKLYKKILSEIEQSFIPKKNIDIFIAKRFAAKEAFAKACGLGFSNPIFMNQITVINNKQGKPEIIVTLNIQQWLIHNNINKIFLSISDEIKTNSSRIASAYVILEG